MLGSWNVNVIVDGMPEKVATAFGKLGEELVGAEYTPIAYLGSQVVNGTNHAVLAEQTVLTGKDTKNVVVVVFNEKPGEMDLTLVGIEHVVDEGGKLGGIDVDVKTKIPVEAQEALAKVLEGYVGVDVNAFALLGTQVTTGVNYIFAAEVKSVTAEPVTNVDVVVANPMTNEIAFSDILAGKEDLKTLYDKVAAVYKSVKNK